jgi:hypothetical protein
MQFSSVRKELSVSWLPCSSCLLVSLFVGERPEDHARQGLHGALLAMTAYRKRLQNIEFLVTQVEWSEVQL